ncbi:hypothetical protein B7802_28850 [Salmonella enterica]|nr:hypothetical protein [Salmonella enterica]ECE6903317.1 hypothetical protein [Salmonella enterica subsp. diarizonae]EGL0769113.1 hypothetical protein [Salmonella enterica subsp. enterica]EAT8250549.1 hypothetical protein [Salmonella enterica]ECI5111231.1 hypothetical protein [Salmonella enterica subsp. diarizonae]
MEYSQIKNKIIKIPNDIYVKLIEHCNRKLSGLFLPNETEEKKAYGILGGRNNNNELLITELKPLFKNMRETGEYKLYMDDTMVEYAHPSSVTPLDKRGWITDPTELFFILKEFNKNKIEFMGSYHMHKVQWKNNDMRDTPTRVDEILGKDSRTLMFIISMVVPNKPIIRAFYEGDINKEIEVIIETIGEK